MGELNETGKAEGLEVKELKRVGHAADEMGRIEGLWWVEGTV